MQPRGVALKRKKQEDKPKAQACVPSSSDPIDSTGKEEKEKAAAAAAALEACEMSSCRQVESVIKVRMYDESSPARVSARSKAASSSTIALRELR